jgi:uncharacterized membrane protein YfbV (UPF0208 family)
VYFATSNAQKSLEFAIKTQWDISILRHGLILAGEKTQTILDQSTVMWFLWLGAHFMEILQATISGSVKHCG